MFIIKVKYQRVTLIIGSEKVVSPVAAIRSVFAACEPTWIRRLERRFAANLN